MYYQHFGLDRPPFKITPDTDFFFSGGNRGAVLDALLYSVTQGEGIVKVTGEVGSGKTMLCRMLQSRLPAGIEQVYLANPNVSPEEILHAITFELGLQAPRERGRIELIHTLQDHLVKRHAEGRQVVVFVEESQSMPVATLEEIRLLSNLETLHHKLLQIVLFGQPELDVMLAQPNIRQLRERIAHSFSLQPLRTDEIREYLSFRLRAAGYRGPDLFPPPLVRYIAHATGGLSRRVNLVADKALLAAFADNTHTLKLAHVQAAVRDSAFGARIAPRIPQWIGSIALIAAGAVIGVGGYWWIANPRTTAQGPTAPGAPSKVSVSDKPPPASESAPNTAKDEAHPGPSDRAIAGRSAPATETSSRRSALDSLPEAPTGVSGTLTSSVSTTDDPPTSARIAADYAATRLAATNRELAKTGEPRFTIQLTLAADDQEELGRYLSHLGKFIESEEVFVYRTRVRDKSYLGVVYGNFATRRAAQAALNSLPEAVRSDRPYVRSTSGIIRQVAG